ncbi:MAG TPA: GNAT family N-acetyltransferase [Acetobacteraceae bacterium]|nr:GNAT family N-acetyltransferase [Acetobacteraceae bacterium]
MGVTVAMEDGAALARVLPDVARLRVTVFRAWPYLYDGTEAYETKYLETYVKAPGAGIAVARDGSAVVGASTCLPMPEAGAEVRAPFEAAGLHPADFFYFGESVLLPAYRGTGVGVRFFELREARARHSGRARFAAFCAVQRPPTHPLRPADAVGLELFWAHRGFTRRPDLVCRMAWKDIDTPGETEKTLTFWLKSLHGDKLP